MGLDHSKATATIAFRGLLVFCINDENQCEMAFVEHTNNNLALNIRLVFPNGVELTIKHSLLPSRGIRIETTNPDPPGVYCFKKGVFDRKNTEGDPEDFRWVMDVEGPEFHDKSLTITSSPSVDGAAQLKTRLQITDCVFYANRVPGQIIARDRTDDNVTGVAAAPVFLGPVADIIGADIVCKNDPSSGIVLTNEEGQRLVLPRADGIRYEIEFNNACGVPSSPADSTDFSIYYNVLSDPDGVTFDLRDVVDAEDEKATGDAFEDFPIFAPNDRPERCDGGFLSQTRRIP